MTREQCKAMLPVIEAFSNGECIEYWDNLEIVGTFRRGMWKTADDLRFGVNPSNYRMIKEGMIHYFDGRQSKYDTLNKYIF
jgi:hypothetical protein